MKPPVSRSADAIADRVDLLARAHVATARQFHRQLLDLRALDPDYAHSAADLTFRTARDRELDHARRLRWALSGVDSLTATRRVLRHARAHRRRQAGRAVVSIAASIR